MSDILRNINWLDIVFIILLSGMVYKGSKIGVSGQLVSLIGLLTILYTSLTFYSVLSGSVFGFLLSKWAKPISFFVISAALSMIVKILRRVIRLTGDDELSAIESFGGIVVASFRAVIFFGLISTQLILTPIGFLNTSVSDGSKSAMFFIKRNVDIYCLMKFRSNEGLKDKVIKGLLENKVNGS